MPDQILDVIAFGLAEWLDSRNDTPIAAVCKSFETAVEVVAQKELAATIPSAAARAQLCRLLGATGKIRGSLLWTGRAEKRAVKMAMLEQIGNKMKSMHVWISSAKINGGDVFAACKRAMILSENPATVSAEVELWMMYIVGAIDTGCFETSFPAWQWFAERGVLDEGHAFWILQLAHAQGDLNAADVLLIAYPQLLQHIAAIYNRLSEQPKLGKYSTHHARLKDQAVHRLLRKAQAHASVYSVPFHQRGCRQEAVTLTAMMRSRPRWTHAEITA